MKNETSTTHLINGPAQIWSAQSFVRNWLSIKAVFTNFICTIFRAIFTAHFKNGRFFFNQIHWNICIQYNLCIVQFKYLSIVYHQYNESHLRGRDHTHMIVSLLLSVEWISSYETKSPLPRIAKFKIGKKINIYFVKYCKETISRGKHCSTIFVWFVTHEGHTRKTTGVKPIQLSWREEWMG